MRSTSIYIHPNAGWEQNGLTVAGGNDHGHETNQLSYPRGIEIDDHDTIYIADTWNHRIVEWKSGSAEGKIVTDDQEQESQTYKFLYPLDVILDKETNNLIISDSFSRTVVQWYRQHNIIENVISNIICTGLAMDKDGCLYVVDYGKAQVIRYEKGKFKGTIVAGGNGHGSRLNQFCRPQSIYVDDDYSVYVSDEGNHRVMKWIVGAEQGIVVAGGNGQGKSTTRLSHPQGIIVDKLGHIYVADRGNNRVVCWCKGADKGIVIIGNRGGGRQLNQLIAPVSLSFDQHGNLYVVDCGNRRVQKFNIVHFS